MLENILKYEDLSKGMDLPIIERGPITRQLLVDYASASGDYNKIHYDEAFAKKAGLKGCIAHGMLQMAMIGSYLLDWAKRGSLKNFKIRFSDVANENVLLKFSGKIIKKYQENNKNLIEIDFKSTTQANRITTQGSAIISF